MQKDVKSPGISGLTSATWWVLNHLVFHPRNAACIPPKNMFYEVISFQAWLVGVIYDTFQE